VLSCGNNRDAEKLALRQARPRRRHVIPPKARRLRWHTERHRPTAVHHAGNIQLRRHLATLPCNRLKIRHPVRVPLATPHRFVSQDIKTKGGIIKQPLTVEKWAGRNAKRRINRHATVEPLTAHARNHIANRLRRMLIIPGVILRDVVFRVAGIHVAAETTPSHRNGRARAPPLNKREFLNQSM